MSSSRYASVDSSSSASSRRSDPSPPTSDLKKPGKNFSLKHLVNNPGDRSRPSAAALDNSSRALARTRSGVYLDPAKVKNDHSFGTMVRKFMEKRSNLKPGSAERTLVVPDDVIAGDMKKTGASKGSNLSTLHRKLFQKGGSADRGEAGKALTEVKPNTRTLAMVLRSERELLSQNKEYGAEISQLRLLLEEKNREVDQLKDLCLKQREEIRALKNAILFPDVLNSQLQDLLEKRGCELKQAKQIIPSLQNQVTSLTGQIQFLREDLAEVKADKYGVSSPRTPILDREAVCSLEYNSSEDPFTGGYGSPDDIFLKDIDINPILTPCFGKTKSKEYYD